jgi:REP element-mobilizing transposase RayT
MSKPIPLEYGHYYHVYNRGINRQNLFIEDRNFRYFLELYAKHITPIAHTFAYCLLYNHFHFLVRIKTIAEQMKDLAGIETKDLAGIETKDLTGFENLSGLEASEAPNLTGLGDLSGFGGDLSGFGGDLAGIETKDLTGFENLSGLEASEAPNLTGLGDLSGFGGDLSGFGGDLSGFTPKKPSQQFSNMFNAYTKAINNGYKRSGPLFERPFDRREVTSDAYFIHLITYIHQNPQKHGLVADFRTWPYSSYRAIDHQADSKLDVKQALAWFGGADSFDRHHRAQADEQVIGHLLMEDFV